jgi:predicted nucleic acid-binding protein
MALRYKKTTEITHKLSELILASLVVLIGPVRQELLSGISRKDTFLELKTRLKAFNDFVITTFDHETAAEFYNICRRQGVQGSHTDFLICAIAHNNNLLIFTTDKDFDNFKKHLPIKLL